MLWRGSTTVLRGPPGIEYICDWLFSNSRMLFLVTPVSGASGTRRDAQQSHKTGTHDDLHCQSPLQSSSVLNLALTHSLSFTHFSVPSQVFSLTSFEFFPAGLQSPPHLKLWWQIPPLGHNCTYGKYDLIYTYVLQRKHKSAVQSAHQEQPDSLRAFSLELVLEQLQNWQTFRLHRVSSTNEWRCRCPQRKRKSIKYYDSIIWRFSGKTLNSIV